MPRPLRLATLLVALTIALPGLANDKKANKFPANRLARETSPYLLLHAHNPVDWYPWGPEAFAKAKAENKPIFLSIGYSSCYWCHVMERESFMDEEIAKSLNARFVCIKVDREERPDVDQVYMTALQAFGSGGWPMSMFLTPDGRPFYGGTYFPPKERDGMPSFRMVVEGVADTYRDDRLEVDRAGDRLAEVVRKASAGGAFKKQVPLTRSLAVACREKLADQFDPEYGGFGYDPANPRRPKFPEPDNLMFLLDAHRRDLVSASKPAVGVKGRDPLVMTLTTMDRMARGGIRDHLAGGYHRYSTNRFWTVPHFEKMLYDNAQLASAHLMAFELAGDPRWKREAEATFAYVQTSMTSPEGGFYSALDAETDGEEGGYYVWSKGQVEKLLGDQYDAFAQVYGLKRPANFEKDRYILLEVRPRAEQMDTLKLDEMTLESSLIASRSKLLAVRNNRPAPLRDDKILTSWNGLMIAAYADGYRVLKDDNYLKTADRAADFLLAKLRTPEGRLLRTYRAGQAKLAAYLEDYTFLAHGLLRLHAATGDPKRLAQAKELTDRMLAEFGDEKDGGFFDTSEGHESLLARPKTIQDNALPSPNSVAVRNLVAIGSLTGQERYLDEAGKTLKALSPTMAAMPHAAPLLLVGLQEYLDARPEAFAAEPVVAVVFEPQAPAKLTVLTAKAATVGDAAITPGSTIEVSVEVTIKEGWHIYANPPESESARPTVLTLAADAPGKLTKVNYPLGEIKPLGGPDGEKAAIYETKAKIIGRLELNADMKPGPLKLVFPLKYQACNDRSCLAPATLNVLLDLNIVAKP